uniref:Inter-alpha-trypsin inhibitor heavy chain H3 n=1 Tax=Cyprinus carpio TaxID=7962 RepID=A0A8C1KHL5_CYPCA
HLPKSHMRNFLSLAAAACFLLILRSDHLAETSLLAIEVQSMRVDCKVASRFAHTVMTTKAFNTANASQEVFFEVDLPKTAFITNFSIEIEGRIYVSEVKEKEKARHQYESAVSSGQTAGLVKASGRNMEKFSVSVNIAPQSHVTFTLTYEELLQRRLGSYEIMIGVRPKQLVQNFEIVVDIYEPKGIAFVDVNGTFITNELLPLVKKTVTDKKAHVYFSPTLDQQKTCSDCEETLIDGDLFIRYDVTHPQDIGEIQIINGYFVHFFAPDDLPQMPKNVVFVIDRSGSMEGEKMKQTREALMTILSELHEDDYFGLVTFDDIIELWRPFLSKATPENVTEAKGFVKTIKARHMTDINKGLLSAVDMLTSEKSHSFPDMSMIILLTDGRPNLSKIQENVQNAINGSMSLFCLGFGYDVDYSLLDTLAKQNDGLARRVYEASDAALQLQGFYDEVATPLLLEVNLNYPGNAVTDLTQSHFRQFFKGSEIVVAGRLQELETNTFQTEVSANGVKWDSVFPDQEYIFGDFTERLWAYLTIQQLLDEREKCSAEDKEDITAQALDLSLKYNFVTPLTSMVVTKPETEDTDEKLILCSELSVGQFYHGLEFEVSEPFPGKDPNKPDAIMFVKEQELVVTRGWQKDFRQDVKNGEKVPCWFIHNNGTGLLDGVHTDYIVSGLFKTI